MYSTIQDRSAIRAWKVARRPYDRLGVPRGALLALAGRLPAPILAGRLPAPILAERLGIHHTRSLGGPKPAPIRRRALSAWSRTWSGPRRR
jgi:hypothetical protein